MLYYLLVALFLLAGQLVGFVILFLSVWLFSYLLMSSLEFIDYSPERILVCGITTTDLVGQPFPVPNQSTSVIDGFPQVYLSAGESWDVANLWAASQRHSIANGGKKKTTLVSSMYALRDLADFLSRVNLPWFYFPNAKEERVLFRYHGDLTGRIRRGEIKVKTAKKCMRAAIQLYKWVHESNFFTSKSEFFEDLTLAAKVESFSGLKRTIENGLQDLRIKSAGSLGSTVEGGLIPLDMETQSYVLDLAFECSSPEIYLMLALGFYTGMRIGSISDLKLLTFKHAKLAEDGKSYYLSIGPGVKYAPVATKFGVTGQVAIPVHLYKLVNSYIGSMRRLLRVGKARIDDRRLVFLNMNGRSYCRKGGDSSNTVNVDIARLRRISLRRGRKLEFKFHQARATFGTQFVLDNLDRPDVSLMSVIGTLKGLMLHVHEQTTMTYIKFVQDHKAKASWSNEFTRRSKELRVKW